MGEHSKVAVEALLARVNARQAKLAVIGLGYVGLPLACELARIGFEVVGVDVQQRRVDMINAGHNPIEGIEPGLAELLAEVTAPRPAGTGGLRATTRYEDVASADIITLNVDTPVDENHVPQYTALRAACSSLGAVLKPGALVIVESTVAPGTSERVVRPILEAATGGALNERFYLGACPERVMPGKLLKNLRELARVCGASHPAVGSAMRALYQQLTTGEVDVADLVTAEIVKTAENAYRDVQIAFANELAMVCEEANGDFLRVRELVNKSPGRNVLFAGAGVGGHCIPKDPWLLIHGTRNPTRFNVIPGARQTNEGMPGHVLALLTEALKCAGAADLGNCKVLVLGYAYLENSDDTRHSPSRELIALLRARDCAVKIHDPFVRGMTGDIDDVAQDADACVLMVAHDHYKQVDFARVSRVMRRRVFVDGRRAMSREVLEAAGFSYSGIGLR